VQIKFNYAQVNNCGILMAALANKIANKILPFVFNLAQEAHKKSQAKFQLDKNI